MKFLCPSCKAKYQIADEKVAGRSVRMKCRKCGYVIPISQIPPAPDTKPPDEADWDAPPPVVPKAPAVPSALSTTTSPDTRTAAPDALPKSAPFAASPQSNTGAASPEPCRRSLPRRRAASLPRRNRRAPMPHADPH